VKKGEIEDVLKIYTKSNLPNLIFEIKPLFENIPQILAEADFAIIRGGAASIVETALSKVFPIIIPMPDSANNHQVKNASVLSKNNAAIMFTQKDYTPEKLFLILSKALNEGLFYFPIINTSSEIFKQNTSQIFASVILQDDLKHLKI
jgi:UDP-N-acetylglucosamine--N-acetylmuramyl-(pentapeptide) pyrophosphoryl-undecaprenol N-acetylglucosamine transferase